MSSVHAKHRSSQAAPATARTTRHRRRRWAWVVLRRYVLPGRPRRVFAALTLLWVLNIFYLIVTVLSARAADFQEGNPVAKELVTSPLSLTAYKLTLLISATIIFLAYRRHRIAELGCWGACTVYLVLAHVWQVYHG